MVYWGIGQHLGYALAQTPRAELLIDVKDIGGDQYEDPTVRGYHTDRRLPFHNDQGGDDDRRGRSREIAERRLHAAVRPPS